MAGTNSLLNDYLLQRGLSITITNRPWINHSTIWYPLLIQQKHYSQQSSDISPCHQAKFCTSALQKAGVGFRGLALAKNSRSKYWPFLRLLQNSPLPLLTDTSTYRQQQSETIGNVSVSW